MNCSQLIINNVKKVGGLTTFLLHLIIIFLLGSGVLESKCSSDYFNNQDDKNIKSADGKLLLVEGDRINFYDALSLNSPDNKDSAEVGMVYLKWRETAIQGDVDAYMSYLADDVVLLLPNAEPLKGKEVIRKLVVNVFNTITVAETNIMKDIIICDNLGYAWGIYDATFTAKADGTKTRELGKVVTLWQRGSDGQWKLKMGMSNPSPMTSD
ncbi:MAG: SgcJ/EcaC family oxidoreductase [Ignavibacteriales bacterium]|nr:MAG: SgcJ/EcaC family oxidoreductase [Ignavibacteriales bacterium]